LSAVLTGGSGSGSIDPSPAISATIIGTSEPPG
jgi:hypothetical protein